MQGETNVNRKKCENHWKWWNSDMFSKLVDLETLLSDFIDLNPWKRAFYSMSHRYSSCSPWLTVFLNLTDRAPFSSPQPFWHQGLVSWKKLFPQTRSGGRDDLGMVQGPYIYCKLYFYYYYISSTSDHQALGPGGRRPLLDDLHLTCWTLLLFSHSILSDPLKSHGR